MTAKEIDGKMVSFRIFPRFDKIYAEIYYMKVNDRHEYFLISNEFGGFWRKPNESDYEKAKEWCSMQIKLMLEANS